MKTTTENERLSGFLPYGRQDITDTDIEAVVAVLKSDLITQGPTVPRLEQAIADAVGADEAVVVSSGTAALHLAMLALDIGPGDWVVVPPITFLATANSARYVGADVSFADVDPSTGLIDPSALEIALSRVPPGGLKAVVPVHFAGQPARLSEIDGLVDDANVSIVSDGCHAFGGSIKTAGTEYSVGGDPWSRMTVFSFHPVKHVAMGEGGAIATNDSALASKLRMLRNHGMQKDNLINRQHAHDDEGDRNPWYYEMHRIGFNYRVTEMQAALGLSQLDRIGHSVRRRNVIASMYDEYFAGKYDPAFVRPLEQCGDVTNAYHLYVVLIDFAYFGTTRAKVMRRLQDAGVGTQVHYIPLHLQPYYAEHYGYRPTDFPGAMAYYERALSIPMYPTLSDNECEYVLNELSAALGG